MQVDKAREDERPGRLPSGLEASGLNDCGPPFRDLTVKDDGNARRHDCEAHQHDDPAAKEFRHDIKLLCQPNPSVETKITPKPLNEP